MNNLWKRFRERYPNAKWSKFKTEIFFGKQNMFVGDEEIAVFDDDGKEFRPSLYFSKEMKQNLGLNVWFSISINAKSKPEISGPSNIVQ